MNPLETPQITASKFPNVYANLGIDPSKRGCIMLGVEPIQASDVILYDDLYVTDPIEHPHMQGVISESAYAHCTLLYGLMFSGTEMKKHVDDLLSGWIPQSPTISEVSFFPSNDPEQGYVTLVAKLEPSANLMEANARLRLLPHIDTHPMSLYQPHVTICYLNSSSDYLGYVSKLNETLQGKVIGVTGINYGD